MPPKGTKKGTIKSKKEEESDSPPLLPPSPPPVTKKGKKVATTAAVSSTRATTAAVSSTRATSISTLPGSSLRRVEEGNEGEKEKFLNQYISSMGIHKLTDLKHDGLYVTGRMDLNISLRIPQNENLAEWKNVSDENLNIFL